MEQGEKAMSVREATSDNATHSLARERNGGVKEESAMTGGIRELSDNGGV